MFWKSAALMATTTFGAGVFALPYLFMNVGWIPGVCYLIGLGVIISFTQELYRRSLIVSQERHGIIGLAELYLGYRVRVITWIAVFGGLIFTLLAYLILAEKFFIILFGHNGFLGLIIFWLIGSLPLIVPLGRFVGLELFGAIVIIGIVFFLIFGADISTALFRAPAYKLDNLFLPFGAILFSLAGWTAVTPVLFDGLRRGGTPRISWGMICGTLVAAFLYAVFVLGILGSAETISDDTLSGLTNFSTLKLSLVALLGLFALWTSYMPIALEAKNTLERDASSSGLVGTLVVFCVPPALYIFGLNDFMAIIGLVGGVFVALSYIFILFVAEKALKLQDKKAMLVRAGVALFAFAMICEIYYFVTTYI